MGLAQGHRGGGEVSEPARKRTKSIATSNSRTIARAKRRFKVPVPGEDGAIADVLDGQTCVLTGLFPEVGGGCGLQLGKGRMKTMIEEFGGRVTSAVSGKTTILVVGTVEYLVQSSGLYRYR